MTYLFVFIKICFSGTMTLHIYLIYHTEDLVETPVASCSLLELCTLCQGLLSVFNKSSTQHNEKLAAKMLTRSTMLFIFFPFGSI